MVDETLYITPHEAALAVVATSMKKARLRLDILIINSIVGGTLFSAGGMLALCAQAENPALNDANPGLVHMLQGMVFPIGLFYVIVMGAELYNSNILYFSVGVCRGAVSIFDLIISWFVSWIFNLGSNLFVCYVICHLSGVTQATLYKQGAIDIAVQKFDCTFIETFIKGIAGNFCVCLAVYLQLLAKPFHVKLLLMALPIFTFVSMGFTHVVADMFLIPMGMFEGAPIPVGTYIWKTLISATLGNAVGGSIFGIIIPFYLHLVVVERDRKLLNLPQFDAKDEQPELEMDSRVVRVPTQAQTTYSSSSSNSMDEKDGIDPVAYRPDTSGADLHQTLSTMSRRAGKDLRSPPGVFPVMGMGEPLTREKTIAGNDNEDEDDQGSIYSGRDNSSLLSRTLSISARRKSLKDIQKNEEDDYSGYNARENALGESLKRVITRSNKKEKTEDPELGLPRTSNESSFVDTASGLFRTISERLVQKNPESAEEIHDRMRRHSITRSAAHAADSIAGIDNFDFRDTVPRPPPVQKNRTTKKSKAAPLSPIHSDIDQSSSDSEANNLDSKLETDDPGGSGTTDGAAQSDDLDLISSISSESSELS